MEPSDLDKIFRDQLEEDTSELNLEELDSKESVWDALDINEEVQTTVNPNNSKKWWLLAATLLLLTFGAGTIQMYDKLRTHVIEFKKMEREYKKVNNEFNIIKNQLAQVNENMTAQIESLKNQEQEVVTTAPKVETQYIETIVYVKDTVYSIERINQPASVEYIRDTIFVKEQKPSNENTALIIASSADQKQEYEKETPSKEIVKPKKVTFVIGKEPIEKPKTEKFQIQVNGSAIARKNN